MTEPMSTPDSGGLREAVDTLADKMGSVRLADGGLLMLSKYERRLAAEAALLALAAHPEPVPTPDSADDATVGERECTCGDFAGSSVWYADCPVHNPATPPADDANRAPVSGGLDEGEREHGTDHGHVVQVRPNGVLSTRLPESGEWFCGHCGMGVPEAADARGVRESSGQDADGSQVRPLASAPNSASSDAGDTSLDRLLSDFYHSDDGDYVAALGDIHKHLAARDAAWVERRAEMKGFRDECERQYQAMVERWAPADAERDTARREAGERIAQALRDAADEWPWHDMGETWLRARADALTSDDGSGA